MADQRPEILQTLGAPVAAMLGQPPADGSALPADQQAAWTALLGQAYARVVHSARDLRFASAQLAAVRADLGLPAIDPPPPPEAPGVVANNPLQTYAGTYAWTSDAQNAQSKLLQTADFCAGVLGDAITGSRLLYWHEGDLFVGALAGDPYGVLMQPNAAGALVPMYVDLTSGQPTGQVGFGVAPIVIGIAVVAVSIAAVWAVSKICDYMTAAHRDDAMQKVADAQQALVKAGKETPEQAAGFVRAATDLASAPTPGPAASPPLWPLAAALAVGLAAGVAGSFAVGRILPAHA